MGLFNKKIRQLEREDLDSSQVNLAKQTSDKAVEVIKELSGTDTTLCLQVSSVSSAACS